MTTTSGARKGLLASTMTAGLLCGSLLVSSPASADVPAPLSQAVASEDVTDLSEEQVGNARSIIAVGRGAGLSDRAIVIALMTAMQESSLRNLDHGDRDSLGLFQQRPSMGWGTAEQVTDPVYASKSFYGTNPEGANPGLLQIDGWESMPLGEAAQAVQRSAYPDRYAQWEDLSRDLLAQNDDVEPIG